MPKPLPPWKPICRGRSVRAAIAVLICFACLAGEPPGHSGQQARLSADTLSVSVDRVNVVFAVLNRKGKLIRNLGRDDFTVFEDDQIQSISNFSHELDVPLTIAFLIDSSGSVRDKFRFERQAAAEFFYLTLRSAGDKALLMSFDSSLVVIADYTVNPAVLSDAMKKIIPGGSTSLYDAVLEAAAHRLADQPGRRVIVVLSDGVDNSSHISLSRALDSAQKNDVTIYAVSTNRIDGGDAEDQRTGDAVLKRLSEETGGSALFPRRMEDLAHAFSRINEQLRSQYSLAYRPTNIRRDGTYRAIRIVPAHKGYKVRCRSGYYAPAAPTFRAGN